ncbi:MAG: flagellin [Tabrizicola sp.]|uniref:flagellin n=1 Tax=Tabrizicola sp. TaxID=2005166 RepID=UPI002733B963|nr:flagellin [Tabrizicola sp.]MDP3262473.1 flagellin [Tabrizicola sp.]MDP3648507.1 flagellin [Paracoccaceae bacterium]MDZ4066034.1 flagellin [Tabrizicola sp.]
MTSILTNTGAMVALQTMKGINANLNQTQAEIATGKSVGSAKDNAAVWAISRVMESDVKGFKGISDSLSVGSATLTVARQASESVTNLLTEMKGKIVAAQAENVDRSKIQTDITALTKQIESVVGAAQFNGLNLVNGSQGTVNVLSSLDRSATGVTSSNISVTAQNLSTSAGAALTNGTLSAASVATGTPVTLNGFTFQGTGGALAKDAPTANPLTTTALVAGDAIALKIGSVEGRYIVQEGDTADSLVSGLKSSLSTNGLSDTDFTLSLASGALSVANNTNAASAISVTATRGTGGLSALNTLNVTTAPASALSAIEGMLKTSIDAAASFGSVQKRIDIQSEFVGQLTDSLKTGIGVLVDANMEEASARLQALQVQQQLATQSLSIANQQPQSLLSLFR